MALTANAELAAASGAAGSAADDVSEGLGNVDLICVNRVYFASV